MERVVSSIAIPADLHSRVKHLAKGYTQKHERFVSLGEIAIRAMERGLASVEAELDESPYVGPVYVGRFPTKSQLAALLRQASEHGINHILSPTQPVQQ